MSVNTLTNYIFIGINIWYEFKEPQVSEFTEALDFRCLECDLERLFWFHLEGFSNKCLLDDDKSQLFLAQSVTADHRAI